MNLGRMFANAIARRVAYVVVSVLLAALLSLVGFGQARAQSSCVPDSLFGAMCANQGDAHAWAQSMGPSNSGGASSWGCTTAKGGTVDPPHVVLGAEGSGTSFGRYQVLARCANGTSGNNVGSAQWNGSCPAGSSWKEELGRCFDPDECLERNGPENGMPFYAVAKPFEGKCIGGCWLEMESGSGSCTSIVGAPPDVKHCSGVYQYTGATCSSSPGDDDDTGPEPGDDSCETTASGLQFCKQPGGGECFSSNSGAKICWGTGETGQQTSGSDAQTRGPGPTEPTPQPPMPPETFDPGKKTGPVTTTTTTNNSNNTTTTTTTTIINNSTTHGTKPPGTDATVKPPGSPDIGDMEGSASGGGDCKAPPVTTGDPVMGMVARQAWETRCAVEKISQVSGTGDIADCASPFSVDGPEDDANVMQMRALREQICPGGEGAEQGDGDAIDWSGLDGPDSGAESDLFGEDIVIGEEGLDTTGLGFSRSCPTIPAVNVFGQSIQFDNSVMCSWLELGGTFVLLLAALASVRIMSGVGT